MAKKGATVQLQTEVNDDDEWELLLERHGLILVDVYSEWCGPCNGMVGILRKLKLEIGGDNLQLAVAKADNITALERFRNKSEPTWMFISNKKMTNLLFGTNAPKLIEVITKELTLEVKSQKGEIERWGIDVTDLMPEEQARRDSIIAKEEEATRIENEARERAIEERRITVIKALADGLKNNTLVMFWPHAIEEGSHALFELWEPLGLGVQNMEQKKVTEEMIEEMQFYEDWELTEFEHSQLFEGKCKTLLMKIANEGVFNSHGKRMEQLVCDAVFGEMGKYPGSEESPFQNLIKTIIVEVAPEPEPEETENEEEHMEGDKEDVHHNEDTEDHENDLQHNEGSGELEGHEGSKESEPPVVEMIEIEEHCRSFWTPESEFSKAQAIKVLFPNIAGPLIPPMPVEEPPCLAVAFDAFKRTEVMEIIDQFPREVIHYGFFSSHDPDKAKLIAKTKQDYERILRVDYGEKMVLQISRKKSEPLLSFAPLGPMYISANTEEGKEECAKFFPEDYDKEEEPEPVEVEKKKKKKKGSKTSVSKTDVIEEGAEGTAPGGEGVPGETGEGEEGAEEFFDAEDGQAPEGTPEGAPEGAPEGTPEGAPEGTPEEDKATSPVPEEAPES